MERPVGVDEQPPRVSPEGRAGNSSKCKGSQASGGAPPPWSGSDGGDKPRRSLPYLGELLGSTLPAQCAQPTVEFLDAQAGREFAAVSPALRRGAGRPGQEGLDHQHGVGRKLFVQAEAEPAGGHVPDGGESVLGAWPGLRPHAAAWLHSTRAVARLSIQSTCSCSSPSGSRTNACSTRPCLWPWPRTSGRPPAGS